MHYEIRPAQSILLEGRQFTPEDVLGTITLDDVELPDGRQLNVFDVLNFLQFRQFLPVDPEAAAAAAVQADEDSQPQRANWYEGLDSDPVADTDGDADDDSGSSESTTTESTTTPPHGQAIDLPKTVLEQLASKGIKTLEDASEFLIDTPDTNQLGISATAAKRLLQQLAVAGLPDGQSPS